MTQKTRGKLKRDLETDGNSQCARWQTHCYEEAQEVSEYNHYKGYFSLVLLALVDAEYKFLWVNVGASGSSSDALIFNCSKLRRRIENGTLVLPPPEPLGPGEPDLYYFLLGDDAFGLLRVSDFGCSK